MLYYEKKKYTKIRPLLSLSRLETGKFCSFWQLPVYPDTSNKKIKFLRNRVRKQLLPAIKLFFNSRIETALLQFAELIEAEDWYMNQVTNELWHYSINCTANCTRDFFLTPERPASQPTELIAARFGLASLTELTRLQQQNNSLLNLLVAQSKQGWLTEIETFLFYLFDSQKISHGQKITNILTKITLNNFNHNTCFAPTQLCKRAEPQLCHPPSSVARGVPPTFASQPTFGSEDGEASKPPYPQQLRKPPSGGKGAASQAGVRGSVARGWADKPPTKVLRQPVCQLRKADELPPLVKQTLTPYGGVGNNKVNNFYNTDLITPIKGSHYAVIRPKEEVENDVWFFVRTNPIIDKYLQPKNISNKLFISSGTAIRFRYSLRGLATLVKRGELCPLTTFASEGGLSWQSNKNARQIQINENQCRLVDYVNKQTEPLIISKVQNIYEIIKMLKAFNLAQSIVIFPTVSFLEVRGLPTFASESGEGGWLYTNNLCRSCNNKVSMFFFPWFSMPIGISFWTWNKRLKTTKQHTNKFKTGIEYTPLNRFTQILFYNISAPNTSFACHLRKAALAKQPFWTNFCAVGSRQYCNVLPSEGGWPTNHKSIFYQDTSLLNISYDKKINTIFINKLFSYFNTLEKNKKEIYWPIILSFLPIALQRRIVKLFLTNQNWQKITYSHIEQFLATNIKTI